MNADDIQNFLINFADYLNEYPASTLDELIEKMQLVKNWIMYVDLSWELGLVEAEDYDYLKAKMNELVKEKWGVGIE